jgi:hypothetical protein
LILKDGRSRTIPSVLHILGLERNMISISKMSDARVLTLFHKVMRNMVRGVMVLMEGVLLKRNSYEDNWILSRSLDS